MLRFYSTQITENQIVLNENDSKHAIKSLRLVVTDAIEIVDGKGNIYTCEITSAHQKKCVCKIISTTQELPLPYLLHVAIAPTKNIDRLEWFLEKATEMGISEITPLLCQHSERKLIKPERLERILVSAMKQSLKAEKPVLHPLTKYKDFVNKEIDGLKFIAHCEDGEKTSLKSLAEKQNHITILIGPEGDFSLEEIGLASKNGFTQLSLGTSRLRTETAALVAVAGVYNYYL